MARREGFAWWRTGAETNDGCFARTATLLLIYVGIQAFGNMAVVETLATYLDLAFWCYKGIGMNKCDHYHRSDKRLGADMVIIVSIFLNERYIACRCLVLIHCCTRVSTAPQGLWACHM